MVVLRPYKVCTDGPCLTSENTVWFGVIRCCGNVGSSSLYENFILKCRVLLLMTVAFNDFFFHRVKQFPVTRFVQNGSTNTCVYKFLRPTCNTTCVQVCRRNDCISSSNHQITEYNETTSAYCLAQCDKDGVYRWQQSLDVNNIAMLNVKRWDNDFKFHISLCRINT